jgi:hypothetical protein
VKSPPPLCPQLPPDVARAAEQAEQRKEAALERLLNKLPRDDALEQAMRGRIDADKRALPEKGR